MPPRRTAAAAPQRISALIDWNHTYNRGILAGIRNFAQTHGNWVIHCSASTERVLPWLRRWRPAGIITVDAWDFLIDFCAKEKMPLVDLLRGGHMPDRAHVIVDDFAVGRMAAEYFLARGFSQFAFAGFSGMAFSVDRLRGFETCLAERGFACQKYFKPPSMDFEFETLGHMVPVRPLQKWLASLPKPAALFACNDIWGRDVIEACIFAKIAVPQQISIVGTDDDELWCSLSQPQLSSIAISWQQIGSTGAELLHIALRTGRMPKAPHSIQPTGVITRRSSDALAVQDAELASALRLVQQGAAEGLSVKSILRQIPINRRALERGFRKVLGRTPLQEILRLRTECACKLLLETDLPLAVVADRAGFSRKHFGAAFKREMKTTPAAYRRRRTPSLRA